MPSSYHRQRLVAEAFNREVAHPLGIGHEGVDTSLYVLGQKHGIGKDAVRVALDDDTLHERVSLLVV